ncbi:uncharacterized protein LOC109136689 isoform X1 [Larimichthys crocea]|uniref:uncharacterized protein LOC109136689 isoform X1 n=1 Tax=Larimichthys crocea TaxID=215358 RepID=UPI000F5D942E|nr:uncharacterized protein LOC109136689 isoform X1 [Larimichthys crocea]XP_019131985.2 uncharacterized protein LOC109136689 isoform X1 [Larimichthys crocea]XP_027140822.1 uncharacterized protein LOC109136689 isoform X1 [Larimichthys crocea]XP_027140823.1 uncharacterized protein LOC109136689 isoform X1 [Larimichthys crocea]
MNSLMDGAHRGCRCQSKVKNSRPRHLHQSTLHLGDTAPCYSTTHHQTYSGRSASGRPLIFRLRDPSFPSQHHTRLDLSNNTSTPLEAPLLSHSQDVHRPKSITTRIKTKEENWAQYRSGQAVREITNPQDLSEYWTSYKTAHSLPVTEDSPQLAGGKPTQWHQHNILTGSPCMVLEVLTGEQRQMAGPGKPSRRSRDKLLWATRCRETDCSALRLY